MSGEKILIIDGDEATRESLVGTFRLLHDVYSATDGAEGLQIFGKVNPDLVITELGLGALNGMRVLEMIRKSGLNTSVIIIAAQAEMKSIIEAMRLGAYDYFTKPLDMERLKKRVSEAFHDDNMPELLVPKPVYSAEDTYNDRIIVGKSHAILDVLKKVGQVSSSRVNVLIQGESGTGKELVSRVIHNSGITKGLPFVAVDFSTLPETLVESELFGHVKGAFTGAVRDRKGRFELAADGTVFLDEISEIPLNLQVKLLRVLQEREFEPVGDGMTVPMTARIIVASNRDLERLVEQGRFREDLFYRISVFRIDLPPLRERKEDIPALVTHILERINRELRKNVRRVPYEIIRILQNHDWAGNVRELENVLMQAVVLAKGDVLEKENLIFRELVSRYATTDGEDLSLDLMEREHILFVLDKTNWDKTRAARLLNISRRTLYNKLKEYRIAQ